MSKHKIFNFLTDLEANNSKEWMDANRARYEEAKDIWCDEIQLYLDRLAPYNPDFELLRPRDTIMRINNNLVYKPNQPVYKDSFGFDPKKGRMQSSFYLHISPNGSFLAGGLYHPPTPVLKAVRAAIDYNGGELWNIISREEFIDYFGGLSPDPDALKTAPKGYDQEHTHIKLLRRKNFTVFRDVTKEEFLSETFVDEVEKAFVLMKPFNEYLDQAISAISEE